MPQNIFFSWDPSYLLDASKREETLEGIQEPRQSRPERGLGTGPREWAGLKAHNTSEQTLVTKVQHGGS